MCPFMILEFIINNYVDVGGTDISQPGVMRSQESKVCVASRSVLVVL